MIYRGFVLVQLFGTHGWELEVFCGPKSRSSNGGSNVLPGCCQRVFFFNVVFHFQPKLHVFSPCMEMGIAMLMHDKLANLRNAKL